MKTPQQIREANKRWYYKNREKRQASALKYQNSERGQISRLKRKEDGRARAASRKYLYGNIPPAPDRCQACGKPTWMLKGPLFVDHDHLTDQFRGHLCRGCNSALGFAEDDRSVLQLLINYLDNHYAHRD